MVLLPLMLQLISSLSTLSISSTYRQTGCLLLPELHRGPIRKRWTCLVWELPRTVCVKRVLPLAVVVVARSLLPRLVLTQGVQTRGAVRCCNNNNNNNNPKVQPKSKRYHRGTLPTTWLSLPPRALEVLLRAFYQLIHPNTLPTSWIRQTTVQQRPPPTWIHNSRRG